LEAIKSQKTINQIAQAEGLLPVQVSAWKKVLQKRRLNVFASGAANLPNFVTSNFAAQPSAAPCLYACALSYL